MSRPNFWPAVSPIVHRRISVASLQRLIRLEARRDDEVIPGVLGHEIQERFATELACKRWIRRLIFLPFHPLVNVFDLLEVARDLYQVFPILHLSHYAARLLHFG